MLQKIELKSFEELTNKELYSLLQLRAEVFIVEQNCPYQDLDGKDFKSHHLLIWENSTTEKTLLAYSRIVFPGISYPQVSIGRVVTSAKVRKSGLGKTLMEQSLKVVSEKFGNVPVKIGAQLYLKRFYESFGFIVEGDGYLEDGIPHIHMIKK